MPQLKLKAAPGAKSCQRFAKHLVAGAIQERSWNSLLTDLKKCKPRGFIDRQHQGVAVGKEEIAIVNGNESSDENQLQMQI